MNVMTGGGSIASSRGTTLVAPACAAPACTAPAEATQTTAPVAALPMSALLQSVVNAQQPDVLLQQEQESSDATAQLLDATATDLTALPSFAHHDLSMPTAAAALASMQTAEQRLVQQALLGMPASAALSNQLFHAQAPEHVTVPLAQALLSATVQAAKSGASTAADTVVMTAEPDAALGFANSALHQTKATDTAAPASRLAQADAVPMQKGGQALVQALAHRIQVQQIQGADVATVRLDPPQMGSLEIRIRQDLGGAVHVQMHASNAEVGRQLTSLIESLRQELQQRSADAQVTVASSRSQSGAGAQGDQQQQSHKQSQQEAVIGQALRAWDGEALT